MGSSCPTLYHGTSSNRTPSILAEGLRDPFLTDNEERARYYAECSAEDDGGAPVVFFLVDVNSEQLGADATAIGEPVMVGGSEEELWKRADQLEQELGVDGWAALPWHVSLDLCGSVRFDGLIRPDQLSLRD